MNERRLTLLGEHWNGAPWSPSPSPLIYHSMTSEKKHSKWNQIFAEPLGAIPRTVNGLRLRGFALKFNFCELYIPWKPFHRNAENINLFYCSIVINDEAVIFQARELILMWFGWKNRFDGWDGAAFSQGSPRREKNSEFNSMYCSVSSSAYLSKWGKRASEKKKTNVIYHRELCSTPSIISTPALEAFFRRSGWESVISYVY